MSVDLGDLRIHDSPPGTAGGSRLFLLLALLLLLPAGFAAGWLFRGRASGRTGAVAVRTAPAQAEGGAGAASPGAGFNEGGWIEVPSYHPIVVSSLIPGRIEEISVLEGSAVRKGEPIARLYDRDLADQLRLAEAEVASARAQLDLLRAGYRKEDVEKAAHEVERRAREAELAAKVARRTATLVPTGAASAEQLERDETASRVAEEAVAAAKAELDRLKAGYRIEEVEGARAALARAEAARDLAKARLGYTRIESPADGVVLERFVTAGTSLAEGRLRIVSLYDPNDLQARVDVRQENAGRIAIDQPVEISTEAEPGRIYHGVVIRVEPLADLKKNTVQAKIRITDPGPGLHPEMICRAHFTAPAPAVATAPGAAAAEGITVPAGAVVQRDGAACVFVVKEGVARRARVRTGGSRGDRVVIEAGLAAGDRVVVDPPGGLADGDEVKEMGR